MPLKREWGDSSLSLDDLCHRSFAIDSLQVGMRHFNYQRNPYHCPIVNLDKLWALVGEEVSSDSLDLVPTSQPNSFLSL